MIFGKTFILVSLPGSPGFCFGIKKKHIAALREDFEVILFLQMVYLHHLLLFPLTR